MPMANEIPATAQNPPKSLHDPSLVDVDDAFQPKLYHALRELQTHLRQTYLGDPHVERHMFWHYAPVFTFLCIFAMGVVVPRHTGLKARVSENPGQTLLALGIGMLVALGVLRGVIWLGARLTRDFCEMEFGHLGKNERGRKGEGEFEMSAANLIVGGIL
ncbi:hypothetical protein Hypma_013563 [Hypsizygus marmoreus]|uniref:Uncharacterized protein n=1 Tax=Hypsizygus marmoreus TaxID=39966 RepID=A0A369JDV0_HYPMA|nr:hypothetical protein Hypma_013563 [Hypsizygus marmoreus]